MTRLALLLALGLTGCAAGPVSPTQPTTTEPAAVVVDRSPGMSDGTPAPPERTVLAARRTARRFLDAYLAFTYGRVNALPDGVAARALVDDLGSSPPEVPTEVAARRPRVRRLELQWAGPTEATAVATIDDGARRYPVVVVIRRGAAGHFLVVELRP